MLQCLLNKEPEWKLFNSIFVCSEWNAHYQQDHYVLVPLVTFNGLGY